MEDLAVLGLEIRSDGVEKASGRLDKLSESSQGAAKASQKLTTEVGGAEKAIKASASAAGQLNKVLQVLGTTMGAAFAFKTLSDFEQSMSSVRAITRATGKDYDTLREKAKQLGASTRYTASQAAEAMRFLGQAGFTTNEILSSSADVLALAQAGAMDLASASEIASKALRGFRLDVSEMAMVTDVMAKAANISNTNIMELGTAFTYVGPVATSFGISINETTAAIAALSDAGLSSSIAGTSLRGILTKLAAPTKQAQKLLLEAGISMDKLNVKTRGLIPVLETLAESGLGVEEAMVIFGQRAGPGFEVLGSSIEKMKRFNTELQNIGGYAKETAVIMDDNLQGSLLNFVSSIEDMAISIAESSGLLTLMKSGLLVLADVFRTITQVAIIPFLDKLMVALGLYIAATKGAALATAIMSTSFIQQTMALAMYTTSMTTASVATRVLTASFTALRGVLLALAASPVFWIVSAGTALYTLYEASKKNTQSLTDLRQAFRKAGGDAEYMSVEARNAASALTALGEQAALSEATASLALANSVLSDMMGSFDRTTRSINVTRVAAASYTSQIATLRESVFGLEKGTVAASRAVQSMVTELQKTDDIANQLKIVESSLSELRKLEQINPNLSSIKTAINDVLSLGGAFAEVVAAGNDLEKVNVAMKKVGGTALAVRAEILELDAVLELINKKPVVPQTAAEAVAFLEDMVSNTDAFKESQAQAEMATAAASSAILLQASALAITEGRLVDAVTILGKYSMLQQMVAGVAAPKLASNKSGESAARFAQATKDKLIELNIKLQQTEVEVLGASKAQLDVYKLKIEYSKELADLNEKAARAGNMSSADLKHAQALTDQIYTMKIAVAEYSAQWDPVLQKYQDAVDRSTALGFGLERSNALLKEQQRIMLSQDPNLGDEERSRRLAVINAEVMKLQWQSRFALASVDDLMQTYGQDIDVLMPKLQEYAAAERTLNAVYDESAGAYNDLQGQLTGLDEAYSRGMLTLEQYSIKAVEAGVALAQIKQDMGDASFVDTFTIALAQVADGFTGVAQGLSQSFGDFFTSLSQGFSDSIGKAIVYSDDLGSALTNVAQQGMASLISAIVQMGIQWGITALLGQTIGAASQATSVATAAVAGGAIAAAYAPAAAMVSLATMGANSVPAMAGLTGTNMLAQSLAMLGGGLPGFESGGYTGDQAKNAVAGVVHGGEYVFSKPAVDNIGVSSLNSMHKQAVAGNPSGNPAVSSDNRVIITQNITVSPGVAADDFRKSGKQINQDLMRQLKMSGNS